MLHRDFFAPRNWFPYHIPSFGSGRAQNDVVAGCGVDTFLCVSVRSVSKRSCFLTDSFLSFF